MTSGTTLYRFVGAPEGFSRRMVELFGGPRDYATGKKRKEGS